MLFLSCHSLEVYAKFGAVLMISAALGNRGIVRLFTLRASFCARPRPVWVQTHRGEGEKPGQHVDAVFADAVRLIGQRGVTAKIEQQVRDGARICMVVTKL